MQSGYLTIETHAHHPDEVRLVTYLQKPEPPTGEEGGEIRAIARYLDIDAGLMHMHQALRKGLIDIESHRYQCTPAEAIAALRTRQLTHEALWTDPVIEQQQADVIASYVSTYTKRQRSFAQIMWIVGKIAITLLFLKALMMLFFFY